MDRCRSERSQHFPSPPSRLRFCFSRLFASRLVLFLNLEGSRLWRGDGTSSVSPPPSPARVPRRVSPSAMSPSSVPPLPSIYSHHSDDFVATSVCSFAFNDFLFRCAASLRLVSGTCPDFVKEVATPLRCLLLCHARCVQIPQPPPYRSVAQVSTLDQSRGPVAAVMIYPPIVHICFI